MSHGVKYFDWRDGRPRWVPGRSMREKGAQPQSLKDAAGNYLPLWNAMLEAHALNRYHGVREPAPTPPAEEEQANAKSAFVYFVQVDENVKIGFSSSPFGRAADIGRNGAVPPTMILVVRGTRKDEARLHQMFSEQRLQGEWFAVTRKLHNLMVRCAQAGRVTFGTTAVKKAQGPTWDQKAHEIY